MHEGRLRGCVVGVPRLAEEARGRADEDEVAVTGALDLAEEGTCRQVGNRQVPTKSLLPPLERKLPDRDVLLGPLARHRGANVQASQFGKSPAEELVDLVFPGQIRSEDRRSAELLAQLLGSFPPPVVVEGDAAALGKPAGADAALGKTTFVTQLGIEGAKQRVRDLLARADSALSIFGAKGDVLKAASRFVAERKS